jgi:hypothetical protein
MAEITGIRAVSLGELIGAPLAATVEAEARAAMATTEFIDTVGFLEPTAGRDGKPQPPVLRMAEFRYTKADATGELAEFTVQVPLLAMVPIPALQVKEARLKLAAKVTDVAVQPVTAARLARPLTGPTLSAIAARPVSLMVKPAPTQPPRPNEARATVDLDIEITLGQADTPLGLEKLLQVLDQAISDRPSGKPGG